MKKIVKIKFIDYDGKLIEEKKLLEGDKVTYKKPIRYFYKFIGWNPSFSKVAKDNITYKAMYKPKIDFDKNEISDEEEFLNIINPILNNKEFIKRKKYKHHGETSVYEHSFAVSYYAYIMAKKLHLKNEKVKNVAIAGILHDFYYKDWTTIKEKKPFFKKHGFVHAKEALYNSRNHFNYLLNKRIENAILRHMFPINITPPKYIEGWLITISDKYVSLDVIKNYKILLSFFSRKRR